MSVLATLMAAAEAAGEHVTGEHEEEPDKTLFYVVGSVLAVFAVAISVVGIMKPEFPGDNNAARGVMALSVLVVGATLASVILTN